MKVVVITGCSSGIGRALVLEFAKRDCFVFATARNIQSIEDLKQCSGLLHVTQLIANQNIDTVELDVTKKESIQEVFIKWN